jgi:glyoxylase-like metal-dependent hydrolase (beta-lactamase superfamily II)
MIQEVADNIYKFRLPMPGRLDHINVYLVKENNRTSMVDTGLPTPESWAALNECLEKLAMKLTDVTDIFVTHSHPDHIGQLYKIRKAAPAARLHMHRREVALMEDRNLHPEESERRMYEWFISNGANELAEENTRGFRFPAVPQFGPEDRLLEGDEKLPLGEGAEGEWEVMWTPGHTAGHFVLHNRTRHMMLSGDHLLGQISSNVGKYPGSTEDPLGDYLGSLNKIAELNLQQVFPAHGMPFNDYKERADNLIKHHRERLEKMYAAVEKQPTTAAQVVKYVWGDRLEGFDRFLALVETLSHLERLVRERRVVPEQRDNIIYYRAA